MKVNAKTEEKIHGEIQSYLSKFSMYEAIKDEQMTFYSNSQKVPCINPLCNDGVVICPECNGDKTVICESCGGTGKYEHSASKTVQDINPCLVCNGTGLEPSRVIQMECECQDESAMGTKMIECKVCGGKGIINQDFCHNCEGSGKVCAICGGSGIIKSVEQGPPCKACGGTGVTVSQTQINDNVSKACKQCGGKGRIRCETCLGKGFHDCESCEGHGHMYRNVKLKVVLDAFPADENQSYVQFEHDKLNRKFKSDHVKIISHLRSLENVKIFRHEDRMVGKLFHNPTHSLLVGVNRFLSDIDTPYNQAYERVELIAATYHFVTLKWTDETIKRILFLNDKVCLIQSK